MGRYDVLPKSDVNIVDKYYVTHQELFCFPPKADVYVRGGVIFHHK